MINKEKYNLISFIINKEEMFYKNNVKWYKYNIKDRKSKEINLNDDNHNYNPTIFIYQSESDIKERINTLKADMNILYNYSQAIYL